jgi:hypothetical protein
MRLTLRLENDRYLDIILDTRNHEITILSPIPDTDLKVLSELVAQYHLTINLPITQERIHLQEELEPIETSGSVIDVLDIVCILSTLIVSEE